MLDTSGAGGVYLIKKEREGDNMTNIQINTAAEYEAMNELYKRLEIDRDHAARDGHGIIVEVINEQRAAIAQAFRDYADRNA